MYPATQRCPRCQNPVAPGATSCGTCGQILAPTGPNPSYGPPPGASYGTLPAPDPYGGGGNYGANPPPTYYNSPGGGIGTAPTVAGSAYPTEPPPPPPLDAGYPGSQLPGGYPGTMQAAYPAAGPAPAAFPGAMPPPPGFAGSGPAFTGSQPQAGFPGAFAPPGVAAPPYGGSAGGGGGGKKIALIVVVVVVLLAAAGGGAAFYLLLSHPKPTISVTSDFTNNGTPVGADGTVLHVSGQKFSSNSSITFLLDGQAAPGEPQVQSDSDGNVKVDLKVTKDWSVDKHTLTAKDAKDDVTQSGASIQIVKPGQNKTPGPNGAPTNSSAAYVLKVTVTLQGGGTFDAELDFTPKDDTGGTICQTQFDNGQQQTFTGTFEKQFKYTELVTYQCQGTYAGGHIDYKEIATKAEFDFDNGPSCPATTPYNEEVFTGDFTSPTAASGTYSADSISMPTCTYQNKPLVFAAGSGTWTGTLSS